MLLFVGALPYAACAQPEVTGSLLSGTKQDFDSTYISSFSDHATGRLYFSRKYTRLDLRNLKNSRSLSYRPNTSLNMGVGATYKIFTLNLGIGFKFLNPNEGEGITHYLDLQSHVYSRKVSIDIYGQFYHGLYLNNTSEYFPNYSKPYYLRPDIRLNVLGFNFQYLFNNRKFSYRAALVQNEWQKKSAGSFLVGMELYSGSTTADSAFVPVSLADTLFSSVAGINDFRFFKAGPNAGYAHTFVLQRHFFATLALSFNLAIGTTAESAYDKPTTHHLGINSSVTARIIAGYNSARWFAGFQFLNNNLNLRSLSEGFGYTIGVGNTRFNLAYRFLPGPKTRKYLNQFTPAP